MFGTLVRTLLLLGISWATVCSAQSSAPCADQVGDSASSRLRNATLLGRSEMQRPQPIPVVRPLRFQEIPVDAESSAANSPPAGSLQKSNSETKDATTLLTPATIVRVEGTSGR